jgi:L-asparaginase
MHVTAPARRLATLLAITGSCFCLVTLGAAPPSIGIAVLPSPPRSPLDTVSDGAGEFEVLLSVARLRQEHCTTGLVSIGDRNGVRSSGGERALRRLALTGVTVVKLAPKGQVAADPQELFVDAHRLSAEQAGIVLRQCLERYGAPPAAADPDRPTPKELVAIRSHLRHFQAAFATDDSALVAVK